jgi:alpha-glucosidase (family GH31 glycosyl hydrolase)
VDQFVISDSTAPGSGAIGIAHMFPRQQGRYNDLQNSMANLINFGAYGVPNVGPSLCGYNPQTSDEELCARYFQLAVVSPLAIMSNGQDTLDF